MNKVLILLAAITIIFACGNDNSKSTTSTSSSAKKAVASVDGKAVYQKNCIACHGVNGDMGVSGAANLAESKLTIAERVTVLKNGREGTAMVSYSSLLDEDEMKAVAEYTLTLGK
jgi:mono/diheme cytochrome c family protein